MHKQDIAWLSSICSPEGSSSCSVADETIYWRTCLAQSQSISIWYQLNCTGSRRYKKRRLDKTSHKETRGAQIRNNCSLLCFNAWFFLSNAILFSQRMFYDSNQCLFFTRWLAFDHSSVLRFLHRLFEISTIQEKSKKSCNKIKTKLNFRLWSKIYFAFGVFLA